MPLARVRLVQCDTALTPDQGTTSGSQSSPTNFNQRNLALAAATAREALLRLASTRLGLPVDQLMAVDGVVRARADAATRVGYGELVAGGEVRAAARPDREAEARRRVDGARHIRPARRYAGDGDGQFEFVHNVRVPGMVHGASCVRRGSARRSAASTRARCAGCPASSRWSSARTSSAWCARSRGRRFRPRATLKASWTTGPRCRRRQASTTSCGAQPSRDALRRRLGGRRSRLSRAPPRMRATYQHPYQMHGSMGTSCAVADVRARTRDDLVGDAIGLSDARHRGDASRACRRSSVRVVFVRGSGCYGINGADTVSYDAALLVAGGRAAGARAALAAGRDGVGELRLRLRDRSARRARCVRHHRRVGLRVVVSRRSAGVPATTRRATSSPACSPASSRRRSRRARRRPPPSRSTTAATPRRRTSPDASAGTCGGTGTVKSERVLTHTIASPFFTGPLRSPSRLQNTFAHESFMDEIAARVQGRPGGVPPASPPRSAPDGVVRAAAKAANWETRPSPNAEASAADAERPAGAAFAMRALRRRQRLLRAGGRGGGRPRQRPHQRDAARRRRRTAGRFRRPTACGTRSKAARCRV